MRIAIVGAGIAGLAAATFLSEEGHDVSLFERFETPRPLGAGLLLQPVGLAVLARLGLDEKILNSGSRIERLYGRIAGKRRTTLDVRYRDLAPHLFGVGIHRGTLFAALFERTLATATSLATGVEIIGLEDDQRLLDSQGRTYGPFDLLLDASGASSALRSKYAALRLDRPYPFGALWTTVSLGRDGFQREVLEQRYKNAYNMIGLLPLGRSPEGVEQAAFFWSLKTSAYDAWRQRPLADWKTYVTGLWPETEVLLAQLRRHEDLTFATYRDVVLKRLHSGRLLFLGDAAHATSPQLGQGANLALVDALVLAESLREGADLDAALELFQSRRRAHLRFYQTASRWLTPFFQSDSLLFAKLRFFVCDLMCYLPPARYVAAEVLSGSKQGLFSRLDPGPWEARYAIRPAPASLGYARREPRQDRLEVERHPGLSTGKQGGGTSGAAP